MCECLQEARTPLILADDDGVGGEPADEDRFDRQYGSLVSGHFKQSLSYFKPEDKILDILYNDAITLDAEYVKLGGECDVLWFRHAALVAYKNKRIKAFDNIGQRCPDKYM